MDIRERIACQLPEYRERVSRLKRDFGDFKIADVTVDQIYGGIRGVPIQVSDISYVDPYGGIRLRGYTIPELINVLPRRRNSEFPIAGGLFYLLMANTLPTDEEAYQIEEQWRQYSTVPEYVYEVVRAYPKDTHPMAMLSGAVLALQSTSTFSKVYTEGLLKEDYWTYYLEDSIQLTAKIPYIAAYIYNLKYREGQIVESNPDFDWAANFAHMIGRGENPQYRDLCRLFFVIHSDHEGGNVSAHASHLVCSALSDVYYASSAGLNGLAGPLHGLANQECLRWLLGVLDHFGGQLPERGIFEQYLRNQLSAGKVIPGYGHAVLRTTDPRFTVQLQFAEKYLPEDQVFQLVKLVYEVLPGILAESGKVKNPWPNVDAINGALQYHYGVKQFDFYTVLFGVSRILGFTAHAVWSRALGKPIERPKSMTTQMLEELTAASNR